MATVTMTQPAATTAVSTAATISRMDTPRDAEKDDAIDLPPREEDDGDGNHSCEWEFCSCYEEGVYELSPFFSTDTGQPEPYYLCLRHYVVWLEYIADVIGETTSLWNFSFESGDTLSDYILNQIKGWTHPADAPRAAIPFPEILVRRWVNKYIGANYYRSESYGDDFDDVPRYIGYNPAVLAAIRTKVRAYFDENGLTFTTSSATSPSRDTRDLAWINGIMEHVVEPILHTAGSTAEAVRQISECDLTQFDTFRTIDKHGE